ncbi:hypothetical protein Taro_020133 [Colocasia esculenta]|uniref:Uncharacterized protein n=1 Tax=Colocasia esculenta TaxID=4460 RepID=A0A843UVM2_COLES|nr:hypothetical protein [Colocasia esculenta]
MPGGANSQSSGANPLPGVDGPGQAKKVIAEAVSKDSGNSAAGYFASGFSVVGSSSSRMPSAAEENRESKSFWGKWLCK